MVRKLFLKGAKKIVAFALTATIAAQGSVLVKAGDYTKEEIKVDISEWLSKDGYYVYPLTPKNPEWQELEDYLDKLEVCKIPPEILKNLSDEQLLQAIIDYPLIYDVFFFSTLKEGTDHLAKTCDAYSELLQRDGAKEVLFNEVIRRKTVEPVSMMTQNKENNLETVSITAEDEIILDALVALTVLQEKIDIELSDEEAIALADASTLVDIYDPAITISERADVAVPMTPNGTRVYYVMYNCEHFAPAYHVTADSAIMNTYGVTLVSTGTCRYNCHSYAWHSQSTDNPYWIPDPNPYMTDGSYTRVMNGNVNTNATSVVPGDIVVYTGRSHSAILTGSVSGEPIATRTLISKWGISGVFIHRTTQVPSDYPTDSLSVWHR